MVQVLIREQDTIFDEDSAGSQNEGEEQVDVDVVPGAMKLPAEEKKKMMMTAMAMLMLMAGSVLPEHSEDKDGQYERDEGGGVASRVHLFEIGEVRHLKGRKMKREKTSQ